MSSSQTQPTPTTSLPPNPNTTNSNPGFNPTQSSTLYLFTFLATLLLLLAVSCAIVIRSFILRRRFRRRIEEAIAAGVLIPGTLDDTALGGMGRSRRRDFGEKPKMWEVWIDESSDLHPSNYHKRDSLGKNEGKWGDIMPVSAMMLSSDVSTKTPLGTENMPPYLSENLRLNFFSRLFGRYPGSTTTISTTRDISAVDDISSAGVGSKEQIPDDERLQVAVLISMPNANAPKWEKNESPNLKGKARGQNAGVTDGEGEIPDVVFGVADVGYRLRSSISS
ncbi:hypothetical protein Clacol_006377 [Clathrus columnatus]|uniref:Uncharacterized protein n=1 Tax=Clathrus columnatus TaxID=1419009 RepID=A0AAV5ABX0_9AGAM|nr:hypothetical protein Clacol_006377 [Clathrus columnatus]